MMTCPVIKSHFRLLSVSLLVLLIAQISGSFAFEQCYYPDGSIPDDYIWEPCKKSTDGKASACCSPSSGDICQEDGLCYYAGAERAYRGTCTDRTWNDPACNVGICVTGYESTWTYATLCTPNNGAEGSYLCGNVTDGQHSPPANCTSGSSPQKDFVTTLSSTSASRYTSPASVDTKLYSVYTSSYTVLVTAVEQTTTLTTAFESTFTSTLAVSTSGSGTGSGMTVSSTASVAPLNNVSDNSNAISLTPGALAGVIIGIVFFIALCAALFFFYHKKRSQSSRKGEAFADDFPLTNGPMGKDQVYPYEAPDSAVTRAGDKPSFFSGAVSRSSDQEKPEASGYGYDWKAVEAGGVEKRKPERQVMKSPLAEPEQPRWELDGTSTFNSR